MRIALPTAKPVLPLGDPRDTDATMRITSPYGQRGDFFHGGIDIGNYHDGDTLIALGDGTVTQVGYFGTQKPSDAWWNSQPLNAAGQRGGLYGPPSRWAGPVWGGQQVDLDLGSGWFARYAHLKTVTVTKGQRLAIGAKLGTIGDTGSAYRQPHLHLGIHYAGTTLQGGWVDPWPLIRGGAHPHTTQEDDMRFGGSEITVLKGAAAFSLSVGSNFRADRSTTSAVLATFPAGTPIYPANSIDGQQIGDNDQWAPCFMYTGAAYEWGYFHTSVIAAPVASAPADCSAQEALIAQLNSKIVRGRTANAGALQAQEAVRVALG